MDDFQTDKESFMVLFGNQSLKISFGDDIKYNMFKFSLLF